MKEKPVVYMFIIVFLVSLSLCGMRLFVDSNSTKILKTCLFYTPIKCGLSEKSEDEILSEVSSLNISKEEAKKRFLAAQKKNNEQLEELKKISMSRVLTREEKNRIIDDEWLVPYYQRALKVLE